MAVALDNKEDLKKEFLETMKELEKSKGVEEAIKDNKILFAVDGVKYRVRKPTYDEQMELEKVRREKYLMLLDDDTMKFRKQWVSIYKKKGIDINQMETTMVSLQKEIDALLMKLATTENDKDVEALKTAIEKKQDEQAAINIEKTDLMGYSIEDALMLHATAYYAYLVLELQGEHGAWNRVFETYADFASSTNASLVNKALYNVNYLIYSLTV